MKRPALSILLLLMMYPLQVSADSQRLPSNTSIHYDLPSSRWQVSSEPPKLAIDAMYADLVHGKKKKGEDFDPEELRQKAVGYMQVNNLYIYNELTEAYLMVSISPFSETAGPPDRKAVRRSAEWAANAIGEHADVNDLSPFGMLLADIEIPGLKYAVQIDTDYPLFGEAHHFIGIIGFSHPYWVFLYYNDKVRERRDLEEMRGILASIRFEPI